MHSETDGDYIRSDWQPTPWFHRVVLGRPAFRRWVCCMWLCHARWEYAAWVGPENKELAIVEGLRNV